jgi:FdhD protein
MKPFNVAKPVVTHSCFKLQDRELSSRSRALPEETPLALVYDGSTEAVMMATPADLEDFAIGFSLTEGIVSDPDEISDLTFTHSELGIELRMWLTSERAAGHRQRRRRLAGPTGCGLCGIESLAATRRALPKVRPDFRVQHDAIADAVSCLSDFQLIHRQTHATHAAGFYRPGERMLVREDVGRHNALDKLAGALSRSAVDSLDGIVVISSRVSIEMVQKTAMIGAGVLVAVSAPTSLAVRTAEAAGITLIAIARGETFEIFSHPQRVAL